MAQNGLLLKFVVMHRWGALSPSRDDSQIGCNGYGSRKCDGYGSRKRNGYGSRNIRTFQKQLHACSLFFIDK